MRNDVKIERDADYGELVAIDHFPDLIMAVAFTLARKPNPLTGSRSHLADKYGLA